MKIVGYQIFFTDLGPFKCYVMRMGGGCQIFRKKRYEGVRFNVISVKRGVEGGPISKKNFT